MVVLTLAVSKRGVGLSKMKLLYFYSRKDSPSVSSGCGHLVVKTTFENPKYIDSSDHQNTPLVSQ